MSDLEARLTFVTLLENAATRCRGLMADKLMSNVTEADRDGYAATAAAECPDLLHRGTVPRTTIAAVRAIAEYQPTGVIRSACEAAWDTHLAQH